MDSFFKLMNNLALYRKYRPRTFSDVRGQDTITRILKNQIKTDRIGHAYLFSGIRGTGKTTMAKVFANAVNCESPVDGNPCGVCKTCKALSEASTMDIIEIDAASNRGVDEIRDLKETISYPPTVATYKVYIIDEVHMLTKEAFNALLKTLEEPPEHAIFLLATTEPAKLPATILSRCQKYNVKPISDSTIIDRMEEICKKEGVNIEKGALEEIALRAGHSMRDALSILDQCVDLEKKGDLITQKEVEDFLGISPKEEIVEIVKAQLNKDALKLLSLLSEFRKNGREDKLLLEDLSEFYKELLYYKITRSSDSRYKDTFKDIADSIAFSELYKIIDLILEAHSKLRFNALSEIVTDTVLLNLCTLDEPVIEETKVISREPVKKTIPKSEPVINDPEPYFPEDFMPDEPIYSSPEPEYIPPQEPVFTPPPEPVPARTQPEKAPVKKEVKTKTEEKAPEPQHYSGFNVEKFKKDIVALAKQRKELLISSLLENAEFKHNKNGLFILIESKHQFMFNTIDFKQKLQNLVNEVMGAPTKVYPKLKEQYYAFLNKQQKAVKKKEPTPKEPPKTLEQKVKEALGDDSIVYETTN